MDNPIILKPDTSVTPEVINESYGRYLSHSPLCSVCQKPTHMEINLLRGRDHLTLSEIESRLQEPGITVENLKKHFKNHFIVHPLHQKTIELKENGSAEALAIVSAVFEGHIDLFTASQGLLEAKAKRLAPIHSRLEFLGQHLENDSGDEIDKQEYVQLNKIATELEDSMERISMIIHKNLLPSTKEGMATAILQYKLSVLSKLIDSIQFALLELEKNVNFAPAIKQLRELLAQQIGSIEDEILKSGGAFAGNKPS